MDQTLVANSQAVWDERLAGLFLSTGPNSSPELGLDALEACAMLAGEEHTHKPKSVSKVLIEIVGLSSDLLTDNERQLLIPVLPGLLDTSGSHRADAIRVLILLDQLCKVYLPRILDVAGSFKEAEMLRCLGPVRDRFSMRFALRRTRTALSKKLLDPKVVIPCIEMTMDALMLAMEWMDEPDSVEGQRAFETSILYAFEVIWRTGDEKVMGAPVRAEYLKDLLALITELSSVWEHS